MDCPTPSHFMLCFFVVCLHYRIIEFIGQLSFCKKRDFMMGIVKKNGACFFFFFFVGVQEKRNIYFSKKERKKNVVIRICSYFIGFTDVYTHTFMLQSRLYI